MPVILINLPTTSTTSSTSTTTSTTTTLTPIRNLELPVGIKVTNAIPEIYYYGPWSTIQSALTNVPLAVRHLGKTVGIITAGTIAEYWWQAGLSDGNLIAKQTGGGGTPTEIIDTLPDYTTTTTSSTTTTTTAIPIIPVNVTLENYITNGSGSLDMHFNDNVGNVLFAQAVDITVQGVAYQGTFESSSQPFWLGGTSDNIFIPGNPSYFDVWINGAFLTQVLSEEYNNFNWISQSLLNSNGALLIQLVTHGSTPPNGSTTTTTTTTSNPSTSTTTTTTTSSGQSFVVQNQSDSSVNVNGNNVPAGNNYTIN